MEDGRYRRWRFPPKWRQALTRFFSNSPTSWDTIDTFPIFTRPRRRSAIEVSQFLFDLREGTSHWRAWRDFTTIPIRDPELNLIRLYACELTLPLTDESRERLDALIDETEALVLARADD